MQYKSDKDRIVFFGLNNCCTQINAMSPALYLFFLILCGFNSYRYLASNSFWLHSDYLVENQTEIKARRGSYTPSVWNTKPDDSIRKCNQLCQSVSRSLHGWRVVFWFVCVLRQAVLFKAAHVEEHEGSRVEGSDRREGAVQYAHPVLQSSLCSDSLQG